MNAPAWSTETTTATAGGDPNTPSWLTTQDSSAGATNSNAAIAIASSGGDLQMVTLDPNADNTTTATATAAATAATNTINASDQPKKTWREFWASSFERDGRTLIIAVLILIAMNIPVVKWGLYPFTIFSTWIHECCHGMAAIFIGGKIIKLEVFADTSGLATYALPGDNLNRQGFVTSAGYQGTPVIGMLLLILRRTKRGPRAGTLLVSLAMILSVILWVRNPFGIAAILTIGVCLGLAAYFFNSFWMRNFYVLLCVTASLNAITSIRALYGNNQEVNGNDISSDAHTMADLKTGTAAMWATMWLLLGIVLAFMAMIFAIPGPDEVADLTLCRMCQDMGCFYICNAKGRRLWSTLFGKGDKDDNDMDAAGGGGSKRPSQPVSTETGPALA